MLEIILKAKSWLGSLISNVSKRLDKASSLANVFLNFSGVVAPIKVIIPFDNSDLMMLAIPEP